MRCVIGVGARTLVCALVAMTLAVGLNRLPAAAVTSGWYTGDRSIVQDYGCTSNTIEPIDDTRFYCSPAPDGQQHVHEGTDVTFPTDCTTTSGNYPVYAGFAGWVDTHSDPTGYGAGNPTGIYSVLSMDAGNYAVLGHLKSIDPAVIGKHVAAGTFIGYVGYAGGVCHLHFEVDTTEFQHTTSINPYPTLTLFAAMPSLIGFDDVTDSYGVKQASLTGTWTIEHSGVRQIALSYTPAGALRIGYVDFSNNFYVKEGALGAGWVLEQSSVADISLAGDLIGYRDSSGSFYVKRGDLHAAWVLEHTNVQQIALAYTRLGVPRIGFRDSSGRFYVKEGYLGAAWTTETSSGAIDIALGGDLIGYRDSATTLHVKEGALGAGWVSEANSVAEMALALTPAGLPRIGCLNGRGDFSVKEGSLTSGWTVEAGQALDVALSGNLIGYRDINNNYFVKEGSINGTFGNPLQTNVAAIALAGS